MQETRRIAEGSRVPIVAARATQPTQGLGTVRSAHSSTTLRMPRSLAIGLLMLLAVSACTVQFGDVPTTSTAPPPTHADTPDASTTQPDPDVGDAHPERATIVGAVESIKPSDQSDRSWIYTLTSGETLTVPKNLSQGCSYWGNPPMSFRRKEPKCAIVALVDAEGTATLVRDVAIPQDEDAEIWRTITGDRLIGELLTIDLEKTIDGDVITDDGFTLEVDQDAYWSCDPTTFDLPTGVDLVIDLDTKQVVRVECMGEA